MKFRSEYLTLAELGRLFGVKEKEVGKWLTDLRLRSPRGFPQDASYVKFLKPQTWGQAHVWHAQRTVEALLLNGWKPVVPPPPDLVAPAPLDGPFQVVASTNGFHEVIGRKGAVAWASCDQNAQQVCRMLNAGHRLGVLNCQKSDHHTEPETVEKVVPTGCDGFVIYDWSAK